MAQITLTLPDNIAQHILQHLQQKHQDPEELLAETLNLPPQLKTQLHQHLYQKHLQHAQQATTPQQAHQHLHQAAHHIIKAHATANNKPPPQPHQTLQYLVEVKTQTKNPQITQLWTIIEHLLQTPNPTPHTIQTIQTYLTHLAKLLNIKTK